MINSRVKIACGLDVHRSKIVGSIVTSAGTNEMRTFTTNIDDTLALKDWILTHECERVAMEATGTCYRSGSKPAFYQRDTREKNRSAGCRMDRYPMLERAGKTVICSRSAGTEPP